MAIEALENRIPGPAKTIHWFDELFLCNEGTRRRALAYDMQLSPSRLDAVHPWNSSTRIAKIR